MNYTNCTLCPRQCGVDRTAGELGFCGMTDEVRIAGAAPHYWEEPVICTERGAGAVFFSGCTLQCIYCQNEEISCKKQGKPVSSQELRQIFEDLAAQGCTTLDLVTPTHFLPTILPALQPKLPIPVVYNCGGYERVETLRQLEGLVDVYLPDLKYSSASLAASLSAATDYVETAKAAILEMFRQTGPVRMQDGVLQKGVIIRHLVLPGQVDNSLGVLDWIADTFRPGDVLVSLMSQYVPWGKAKTTPGLDRPITVEEYDGVLSYMELLGMEDGFVQDFSSATEAYIPQWDF
ncbi:MAG: 4Fe-4S cluster-binding domain-containing protein [Oscillospiraceae bacterium]|nr:4Fe-4S cluster-binding domain-containing protein [Oscillospiraceae bacterium]